MTLDPNILFTPFNLRGLLLSNRIVMVPLTRDRAVHGTEAPSALNAEYYAQRAGAGYAPLNPLDSTTLYGGDAKGYTDYPTLNVLLL